MIGLWIATALGAITVEPAPIAGTETVVLVVDEAGEPRVGETVRVRHRPGLTGEEEVAVGITDGRGRVRWTPEVPGVATLQAGDEPHRVRVAWARLPITGSLLLALIALGGAWALGYAVVGAVRRR